MSRATNVYEITEGSVKANIEKITVDKVGTPIQQEVYKESLKEPKADIEIIDNIMYHTIMSRKAIYRILTGIERRELLDYQDILEDVTKKISKMLIDEKANNIVAYEVIDGYELDWAKIIETDIVDDESFNKVKKVFRANLTKQRALNKFYKMDSEGEYDFAKQLEEDNSVILFTKLKKGGFVIDTPYGNYSPDWAVIVKEDATQDHRMYFIIEFKFGKEDSNLTEVERNKIEKCGKLHFKKYILCYHNDGEALFDFDGKIVEGHFKPNKNEVYKDEVVKNFVTQIKNDDTENFLDYKKTIDFFEDNKYTVKINTQKLEQSYFPHSIFDYKESKFFTNGRNKRYFALCKKDSGKWGLVNARGDLIVPFKYDDLGPFVDNEGDFIHIEVAGKYGLIDCLGNIVIKPIYDDVIRFFDGLALVEQNKKFGYIDTSGNVVIPIIYEKATNFEFARAIVTLDNRTFCINRYGEEIEKY